MLFKFLLQMLNKALYPFIDAYSYCPRLSLFCVMKKFTVLETCIQFTSGCESPCVLDCAEEVSYNHKCELWFCNSTTELLITSNTTKVNDRKCVRGFFFSKLFIIDFRRSPPPVLMTANLLQLWPHPSTLPIRLSHWE